MAKNLIHFESQQEKVEFEALVEAVTSPRGDSNGQDRSARRPVCRGTAQGKPTPAGREHEMPAG